MSSLENKNFKAIGMILKPQNPRAVQDGVDISAFPLVNVAQSFGKLVDTIINPRITQLDIEVFPGE